jgi:hypothetical protein
LSTDFLLAFECFFTFITAQFSIASIRLAGSVLNFNISSFARALFSLNAINKDFASKEIFLYVGA